MSLEQFKSSGLSFNSNFLEQTSQPGVSGYRGELVLVEGEIADASLKDAYADIPNSGDNPAELINLQIQITF